MTPDEMNAVKKGDTVKLRGITGRVVQHATSWFMVRWDDTGQAEIVRRVSSILGSRLELVPQAFAPPPLPTRRERRLTQFGPGSGAPKKRKDIDE